MSRLTDANDNMLIGNCIEGYTPSEMASWDLRQDAAWQERIAEVDRFTAWLDGELR